MKILLVFDDWRKNGESIYNTEEGVELSCYSFHSGTTFRGEIHLNEEDEKELQEAIKKGYQPQFWIAKE